MEKSNCLKVLFQFGTQIFRHDSQNEVAYTGCKKHANNRRNESEDADVRPLWIADLGDARLILSDSALSAVS